MMRLRRCSRPDGRDAIAWMRRCPRHRSDTRWIGRTKVTSCRATPARQTFQVQAMGGKAHDVVVAVQAAQSTLKSRPQRAQPVAVRSRCPGLPKREVPKHCGERCHGLTSSSAAQASAVPDLTGEIPLDWPVRATGEGTYREILPLASRNLAACSSVCALRARSDVPRYRMTGGGYGA